MDPKNGSEEVEHKFEESSVASSSSNSSSSGSGEEEEINATSAYTTLKEGNISELFKMKQSSSESSKVFELVSQVAGTLHHSMQSQDRKPTAASAPRASLSDAGKGQQAAIALAKGPPKSASKVPKPTANTDKDAPGSLPPAYPKDTTAKKRKKQSQELKGKEAGTSLSLNKKKKKKKRKVLGPDGGAKALPAAGLAGGGRAKKQKENVIDEALVSYPRPRNFAERLMRALELGISSDSVWWVDGGKAIALRPRTLKVCPELTSYFKTKDYSGFIRNCNRWGFSRVTHYDVPTGVVTYENALFKKDEPHLVRHMRMDSDVQEIFAKHKQGVGKDSTKTSASTKTKKTPKAAGDGCNVASLPTRQAIGNREKDDDASEPSSNATNRFLAQQPPVPAVEPVRAAAPIATETVALPNDSSTGKEIIFRRMLMLAGDFLAHPGRLYVGDVPLRQTMELILSMGRQHRQALEEAGRLQLVDEVETNLRTSGLLREESSSHLLGRHPPQGAAVSGTDMPSLLGRAAMASGPALPDAQALEALLLRSRQLNDHQVEVAQLNRDEASQGVNPIHMHGLGQQNLLQGLLSRDLGTILGHQREQGARAGIEQVLGQPPSAAVNNYLAAQAAAVQQVEVNRPHFTSAEEMMLRVMNQNSDRSDP